jgi:SnoaL-like domain
MFDSQRIADRYIAVWNEADADRRMTLLRQHWTEDASYVDPMASVAGIGEIGRLVGAVQERFPGFTFALTKRVDGHGNHVRFSWTLGPLGAEPPIEGSDVLTLQGGRIASVIGFLDKVPA